MAPADDSILTTAEVRQLVSDVQRDRDELRRAQARLEESERKLAAVETLIGRARVEQIAGGQPAARTFIVPHHGGNSPAHQASAQGVEMAWTDWIVEALGHLGGTATSKQLVEAARADDRMAERMKRTPNGYYNAIARVLARNRAKRVGQLLALPDVDAEKVRVTLPPEQGGPLFN